MDDLNVKESEEMPHNVKDTDDAESLKMEGDTGSVSQSAQSLKIEGDTGSVSQSDDAESLKLESDTGSVSQSGDAESLKMEGDTGSVSQSGDGFKAPDAGSSVGFRTPMLIGAKSGFKKPAKFENPLLSKGKDPKNSSDKSDKPSTKQSEVSSDEARKMKMPFSPAEQLKFVNQPGVCYKEPSWGGLCTEKYSFEILKSGTIVDTLDLTEKSYFVFGRLPSCDITMEHPSLSRYHCVIQYCATKDERFDIGWYLYDLDSTHGTVVNKVKVKPREYTRLRVGHVVKFGGSTRLHILQGPDEDMDAESELTVSEIIAQREKQKAEAEVLRLADEQKQGQGQVQGNEDQGCSWGMGEDPVEVDDAETRQEVPFNLEDNEALYIDDPKKALKRYFEREGLEMPEYEFLEAAFGKHRCRIELPIDDNLTGEPLFADITASGKKREAVIACALEACRVLDRNGELRKSNMESRKRKAKNWAEDDFYDSDEDTFLDRTGTIEKKRIQRMQKTGKAGETETYQTLVEKLKTVEKELSELEIKLEEAKQATLDSNDIDDLDAYMLSIKSGAMDKTTRIKIKRQIFDLKKEEQKLRKLANLARPPELPELKPPEPKKPKTQASENTSKTQVVPSIGKIKGPSLHSVRKLPQPSKQSIPSTFGDDINIVEDEDDDEEAADADAEGKNVSITQTISDSETRSSKSYGLFKPDEIESKREIETKQTESDKKECENFYEPEPKKDAKVYSVVRPTLDFLDDESKKSKSKTKKDKLESSDKSKYSNVDEDENIDSWIPPTDQSGDGKTSLNAKYGY